MKLLAVETSCDETAISILDFNENQDLNKENIKFSVLSNHVLSQINIHKEFGGVFPALAKREHAKNIVKIFEESLKKANLLFEKNTILDEKVLEKIKNLLEREPEMYKDFINLASKIKKPNLEAIAITKGPGLAPALWVGVNFAKALALLWDIKIYPINHMEGHILSSLVKPLSNENFLIEKIEYPALALLISGGHTEINYFEKLGIYKKIGQTLDDAAGEAFDKVARSLGLPYPGGPEISKIAKENRENNLNIIKDFILPRPMLHTSSLDFSFSGLKTAVINTIKKMQKANLKEEEIRNQISLDFENAVSEILLKKVKKAIEDTNSKSLLIGGGVIANNFIREEFSKLSEKENIKLYIPEKFLTGDNAFMIGIVAIWQILNKKESTSLLEIQAESSWNIENV